MNIFEKNNVGFIKNNPVLGLSLGLTTALAITTSLTNAVGMGIIMLLLLYMTSILCGMARKAVSADFRLPVNLAIIAFLVKLAELLIKAYAPKLAEGLGAFLPLLVASSLLLIAAGTFDKAEKTIGDLLGDNIKAGFAYFLALVVVAFVREILGTGGITFLDPFRGTQLFSFNIIPTEFAIGLFVQPAGALFIVALVAALFAAIANARATTAKGGK